MGGPRNLWQSFGYLVIYMWLLVVNAPADEWKAEMKWNNEQRCSYIAVNSCGVVVDRIRVAVDT